MPGILYIVATPIGNLDDMPPRVAATFGAADFVAAEDTRVTLKLLNHLGLKKPMMSYYEHALHHGAAILDRIEAGESCALCSDAGMPCISDPGEQIVKDAIARGITVTPVPGASACVTALAVSGQDTARFVFEGFLPVPKKERRERLEFLQGETRTVIFYEAPHKLRGTLDDLCAAFGAERSITLCRELTKLHEEITKTTIGEAVRYYEQNDPRGEYVLVMAGTPAVQAAAGGSLGAAIEKGLKSEAKAAAAEMLKTMQPLEVVDGHLIPALDRVGEGFEAGKVFLPQLLQSAAAAQSAFEAVKDAIAAEGSASESKGKIVLATVKGDIHDIGKNIVKVILENYGFTVLDLGRDVPPEAVVQAVRESGAPLVGLSALMTTTVKSMEETIRALHESGLACKVMVGGAVLTPEYAEMIGADYYAKDAKRSADIAKKLFGVN